MTEPRRPDQRLTRPIPRLTLLPVLVGLLWTVPALAQEGARRLTAEEEAAAAPPPQQMVLTKPPQLATYVEAIYPEAAKAEQKEAEVVVILTLSAEGAVTEATLQNPPVGDGFDEAAIEAAKQLVFTPAEINGQPASIRVPFKYTFKYVPDPVQVVEPEAEFGRVVGRVRERGTRLPLPAVPVSIGDREVISDGTGRFTFEDVPEGEYELVATSTDHRRERVQVAVVPGQEIDVDLRLQRLRSSPYETIVRGDRAKTSLTRRTLEKDALRTVPGTFGDPLRAIQNLPGIARAPYIVGVLLVRGSTPGDSAVMIDGHEVPLLFHFLGGPSVLPPEMLDRIDYYPGNFSVRFGRAMGGVVDVGTRRTTSKQWQGSLEIDLFDTGLYLEGPITDDISFSASVRRSYIDVVLETVIDVFGAEDLAQVLPRYYDYQARTDWRIDRNHELSLLVFGSDDELEVIGQPGTNTAYDVTAGISFHRLKLEWRARLSKEVEFSLSPVLGVDTTGGEVGEVEAEGEIDEVALRYDLRIQPSEELVLRTGFDGQARVVTFSGNVPVPFGGNTRPLPGANPGELTAVEIERDLAQVAAGLYLEAEWNIGGGPLTIVPGVRTDHYDWAGRHRWFVDPRVTARWVLDEEKTWVLKGGVGVFSQPPTEFRLDPDFGNPDLEPEWAIHYGLGIEHQISEAISIDVQGFYIDRRDLSDRVEGFAIEGFAIEQPNFLNIASGRAYGVELLLKHEVTRDVYGWVAYTLSRSEEDDGPGTPMTATPFDQTHNLVVVASWKFAPNWETGLRFRLVSGNLETPVLGATFDADEGTYVEIEGEEDSRRVDPFNQLDIRVERTWDYETWNLAAFVDVQNVYNALNPEGTRADYRFREFAPLPGLTVLPTLGVRGSF